MTANIKSKFFKGNVCENGTGEQGLLSRHTNPQEYPIFCCLPVFTYLKSIAETLPIY